VDEDGGDGGPAADADAGGTWPQLQVTAADKRVGGLIVAQHIACHKPFYKRIQIDCPPTPP